MDWDASRHVAGVAPEAVRERLRQRPASWLLPFLQLAAQAVDPDPPAPRSRHWYRLGPADEEGRLRLLWRPRGHPGLFIRFDGELTTEVADDGCVLALAGAIEGDPTHAAADEAALDLLLSLLASALADGHEPG